MLYRIGLIVSVFCVFIIGLPLVLCVQCNFGNVVNVNAGSVCAGTLGTANLLCWGDSNYLQNKPVNESFSNIASGHDRYCGVTTNGTTLCWGKVGLNYGNPPAEIANFFTQVAVAAYSKSVLTLYYTCGIRRNDSYVQCWNDTSGWDPIPPYPMSKIEGSTHFVCGITTNETIVCWKQTTFNGADVLGYPSGSGWIQLSANLFTGCALHRNGSIVCWGSFTNTSNQLFDFVEAGKGYVCGLTRSDRYLVCWGSNYPQISEPLASINSVLAGDGYCITYLNYTITCTAFSGSVQFVAPTECTCKCHINNIIDNIIAEENGSTTTSSTIGTTSTSTSSTSSTTTSSTTSMSTSSTISTTATSTSSANATETNSTDTSTTAVSIVEEGSFVD